MLLVSGRFCLSKTIIPEAQEHFLTPLARRDTHPFGGLGLRRFVDHGLKDQLNIIHLPDETLAQIQKIHSATETLSQSLARTPNVNEISEATGMRRSRVITLVQHNNDVEYLDLHKHDYHQDWATGKTSETPQEWSEQ